MCHGPSPKFSSRKTLVSVAEPLKTSAPYSFRWTSSTGVERNPLDAAAPDDAAPDDAALAAVLDIEESARFPAETVMCKMLMRSDVNGHRKFGGSFARSSSFIGMAGNLAQ